MSHFRFIGLVLSLSLSNLFSEAKDIKELYQILENNCVSCHGDEKKKGGLNLSEYLSKDLNIEDVDVWGNVVSEVQSGNMPPEDEEEPLSLKDEDHVIKTLMKHLGKEKAVAKQRMITPDEFKNSLADLFHVDLENFDPIGDLSSFINHDHHFYTVDNSKMMNIFYFTALKEGATRMIEEYHADNKAILSSGMQKKLRGWEKNKNKTPEQLKEEREKAKAKQLAARKKRIDQLVNEQGMTKEQALKNMLTRDMKGYSRLNPKSKNDTPFMKFPMKLSPLAGDCVDGYFEFEHDYWGIRAKSWDRNYNTPIDLFGGAQKQFISVPPGKYRLVIKASAHHRESIAEYPSEYIYRTLWNNNNRLAKEKSKLTIYKTARISSSESDPDKQYVPLTAFRIDDNEMKEYSAVISSDWNMSLGILFENGVVNLRNYSEEDVPAMTFDEEGNLTGFTKSKKKAPTIRLYDITLEKIEEVDQGEMYIDSMSRFDDKAANDKIKTFIQKVKLSHTEKYLNFYQDLRKTNDSVHDCFVQTINWAIMTNDFLYLNPGAENKNEQLRYAAYALTKSYPSREFEKYYQSYQLGELDAASFTEALVKNKAFDKFVTSFTNQWLRLTELDTNAPDRSKYPMYYEYELKRPMLQQSYERIKYLFEENARISELVDSDYMFINDALAQFYGLEQKDHFDIEKVAVKDKGNVGILKHASFMASHSNGVEDLPFRRSKWISENLLDKRIPPPPDNIDVSEFEASETHDFASKIKAHMISNQCMDCHKILDDMAIKLHNFDSLGMVKPEEASPKKALEALVGLKEKVTRSNKKIASAFTKNLMSFITGRKTNLNDLEMIAKILDETREGDYKTRDILERVIHYNFPVSQKFN